MPPLPRGVSTGARVLVRGQRWRVDAVLDHPDCRELHLAGTTPPDRCIVLWPFDRPIAADGTGPPRTTSVRLKRWAAAIGAATAGSLDPLTPRGRATATILPYQLAPAIAMAAGVPRLILADEVGLGKTIQAGWIVKNLLAREPGSRILIAVPAGLRRQWQAEIDLWVKRHPKPWDEITWKEYHKRFEGPMQKWLDAGHGSCVLKQPSLREIVMSAFQHYDGQRYRMGDYVIMPNHVHVLFAPLPGFSMKEAVKAWKRYSGHRILKSTGGPAPFWLEESFDHIVRSESQLRHYQRYIRENPQKAFLQPGSWTHWEAAGPDGAESGAAVPGA